MGNLRFSKIPGHFSLLIPIPAETLRMSARRKRKTKQTSKNEPYVGHSQFERPNVPRGYVLRRMGARERVLLGRDGAHRTHDDTSKSGSCAGACNAIFRKNIGVRWRRTNSCSNFGKVERKSICEITKADLKVKR